eukprot:TRINITY_DN31554_c0_g1_i1.p1 TRINITY_DN31554_c0_g1~~TRINITY_DN31554_c0_g1_i1.p1  ORF type:complete len:114 (+),score=14.83 TRINITY_DN31554_c0_g1_i1:59-400(+)
MALAGVTALPAVTAAGNAAAPPRPAPAPTAPAAPPAPWDPVASGMSRGTCYEVRRSTAVSSLTGFESMCRSLHSTAGGRVDDCQHETCAERGYCTASGKGFSAGCGGSGCAVM